MIRSVYGSYDPNHSDSGNVIDKLPGIKELLMEVEAVLLHEPNLVFETAMLLFNSRNDQSCRDLKQAILKKFAIDENVLNSCFDAIIELSEFVTGGIESETDPALLDFLFARHSSMKGCFAFYLIHDVCRRPSPDFKTDIAALREQSKALFFVNFSSMLVSEFAPDDFSGVVTNFGELFSFIEKMPVPEDEKWQLCKLYNNYEEYRELLADILSSAGDLFMRKYESVKHYIGWFLAAVNEPLNAGGAKFIESNYSVKISSSTDCLYLQPSIAMCNTTQYLMSYTSQKITDFLYVGVLFEPLREITDVSTVDDKLCRSLRTMGDNRKFEILKLLAEGAKYGQQIASLMDLSTATVSHHMSMLLEAGFVEIKRESNRIYYALNRKKIRDFLEELNNSLLSDGK